MALTQAQQHYGNVIIGMIDRGESLDGEETRQKIHLLLTERNNEYIFGKLRMFGKRHMDNHGVSQASMEEFKANARAFVSEHVPNGYLGELIGCKFEEDGSRIVIANLKITRVR